MKFILPVLVSLSLFSCAISKAIYLGSDDYAPRAGSPLSEENKNSENINGIFPDAVYIKTRTQTFNLYHYYILHDGLVWYKSINSENEPKDWSLLTKKGRPDNTNAIVEISADADELAALSKEGNFYRYFFDRTILYRNNTWLNKQGWPVSEQIYFDQRTSKNRSWALGKRNHHVLYYEDIFGNQHHNGTMEIATTYVLLEDGQEICYGDSGLPSDFSRNFIGPERGAFKAVSLSASASTMFVINEEGEMYTRLADFDTLGCDPMFFKYTYIPYKSNLSGTEYFSNLNEWGLPSEDWRMQPRVHITEKAAITRHITILQNGQGNSARELRIAGLNEQGKTGYWSKQIFDERWNFIEAPLFFSQDAILITEENFEIGRKGERGLSLDKNYSGFQWNLPPNRANAEKSSAQYLQRSFRYGNEKENDWEYQIPNFNILEGDCDLLITRQDETCILKLYPVEMWTYQKRDYLPGRKGSPKMFLATMEIPDKTFESLSEPFVQQLIDKFAKYDKKLFHYIIAAANNYIIIREFNNSDFLIYLTDGTISGNYSEMHFGRYIENFEEAKRYYSPQLVLSGSTNITAEELNEKISLNRQFAGELKHKIRELKWSQLTTFKLNTGYLPAHNIAKITPLRFIDVPKIKTITSFGSELVLANSAFINTTVNARIWLYENIINMLETRILCYNNTAKELSKQTLKASELPFYYSENIYDYLDIAGLPREISGTFYSPAEHNKIIQKQAKLSFIPPESEYNISGWFLAITENSNTKPDNFSIFIEAGDCSKNIYNRKGKTPLERKLQLDCTMFISNNAVNKTEKEVIEHCLFPFVSGANENINIRISFNGKTLEIREYPPRRSNSLIFSGNI